jgi:hypothetical protein
MAHPREVCPDCLRNFGSGVKHSVFNLVTNTTLNRSSKVIPSHERCSLRYRPANSIVDAKAEYLAFPHCNI